MKPLNQNKMEKEFIPYKLAVKLKALGFDEPCAACYYKKFDNEIGYHKVYRDFNFVQLTVSAPTYSQAFRWFREKYNLKSWIEEYTKNKYIYEIRPHKIIDYKEGEIYVYATYEEAELACLDKLIEIVETKSE